MSEERARLTWLTGEQYVDWDAGFRETCARFGIDPGGPVSAEAGGWTPIRRPSLWQRLLRWWRFR